MKLYILFGQRNDSALLPEALEVADSHCTEENPELLTDLHAKHAGNSDLRKLEWFTIDLLTSDVKAIQDRLNLPANLGIAGGLKPMDAA